MLPAATRAQRIPSTVHSNVTCTCALCNTKNFVTAHDALVGALVKCTPGSPARRNTVTPFTLKGRKCSPTLTQSSSIDTPFTTEPQGAQRDSSASARQGERRYLRPAGVHSPVPSPLVNLYSCTASTRLMVPSGGETASSGPSAILLPCLVSKIQPPSMRRKVESPILTRRVAATMEPFWGPWPILHASEMEHLDRNAMPLLPVMV
mmetsp:Transcript_148649/g.414127  ORF Transcript_148649/g.414127 Transcript_148649/m.414127 type:complete len:206 (-) Transcript_148649:116-733(-)